VVNRDSVQEVEGKVPDQTEQGAVVVNRTVLGGSRVVSKIRRIGVERTRPGAVVGNRAAPGEVEGMNACTRPRTGGRARSRV
jgi:hypothetical protein